MVKITNQASGLLPRAQLTPDTKAILTGSVQKVTLSNHLTLL